MIRHQYCLKHRRDQPQRWLCRFILLAALWLTFVPPTALSDDHNAEDDSDDNAIELSAELQFAGEYRNGAQLSNRQRSIGAEFTIGAEVPLSADWTAFAEFTALVERSREHGERYRRNSSLERGELWLRWQLPTQATLTLGRQSFSDDRQWWWDEDLDALRLQAEYPSGSWSLAVARETVPRSTLEDDIEPEDDDLLRALGHWQWNWSTAHRIDAFALLARDRSATPHVGQRVSEVDESDANLNWLGLRASGSFEPFRLGNWRYWIDAAAVRGHEQRLDFGEPGDDTGERDDKGADDTATAFTQTSVDQRNSSATSLVNERQRRTVRGWALDLGASWQLPIAAQPVLFAGLAIGSGDDDPEDATDRRFRQTGLQENKSDFRYYGELFAPELGNLRVVSAGIRLPLNSDNGDGLIGLSYHRYTRLDADAELQELGIDADPDGRGNDLGWEMDLVLKHEFDGGINLETSAAMFQAGSAFGANVGERAYRAYLELTLEF